MERMERKKNTYWFYIQENVYSERQKNIRAEENAKKTWMEEHKNIMYTYLNDSSIKVVAAK